MRPKRMRMKADSCEESRIKKPIVIKSKEIIKMTVPICNNGLFPNFCKIHMANIAPTRIYTFIKNGTIDRKLLLA